MSETKIQDARNHAKIDPIFHFVISPIVLLNIIYWATRLVRHPSLTDAWGLVVSVAIFLIAIKMRLYPLQAQDRVIRLEERLRLMTVLPEPLRRRIAELTEDQLIGLRFASDGELEALVPRVLDEKMNRKQIKEAIRVWRPDHFRI